MPAKSLLRRVVQPTDPVGRIEPMRVAVIDVGSNTARLMVAEQRRGRPQRIGEAKAYLGLGAEIIRRGHVGPEKLSETAVEMERFTAIARELAAEEIDVFVTAPARQAGNADQLVATIARATGRPARVLTAKEEGELAYEGAIATTSVAREPVAVCDVGGGSTEITVGDRKRGPFWSDSVDLGSLRLTATTFRDDPPTPKQLGEAEKLVAGLLGADGSAEGRHRARRRRQRASAREAHRPHPRRAEPRPVARDDRLAARGRARAHALRRRASCGDARRRSDHPPRADPQARRSAAARRRRLARRRRGTTLRRARSSLGRGRRLEALADLGPERLVGERGAAARRRSPPAAARCAPMRSTSARGRDRGLAARRVLAGQAAPSPRGAAACGGRPSRRTPAPAGLAASSGDDRVAAARTCATRAWPGSAARAARRRPRTRSRTRARCSAGSRGTRSRTRRRAARARCASRRVGLLGRVEREVHVAVGEVGRQQVEPLVVGALDQRVDVALAAHELARRRPSPSA